MSDFRSNAIPHPEDFAAFARTAEQTDVAATVERVRDVLPSYTGTKSKAYAAHRALDSLAAALERAERERDGLTLEFEAEKHGHRKDNEYLLARAQKAEARVTELEGICDENDAREASLVARAQKSEAALREITRLSGINPPTSPYSLYAGPRIALAALDEQEQA